MADLAEDLTVGVLGDAAGEPIEPGVPGDATVVRGAVDTVYDEDPTIVVAVGGSGVRAALESDRSTPIYPVGVAPPFDRETSPVSTVVDAVRTDSVTTEVHRVLEVETPEATVPALLDVTVMTAAPGRISEYGIEPGDPGNGQRIRADGIVVTTPFGSTGYAAAAGGPSLSMGIPAVGIVPVAPFAVSRTTWVDSPPVSISVRRDESPVKLFTDGDDITPLAAGDTADISWGGDAVIATVSPADEKT